MTRAGIGSGADIWNAWRIGRWTAAAALLLTPLVMMQVSDEWHWSSGSFLLAGVMIGGTVLLYELAERGSGRRAYRIGVAVALLASFLTVWTTIVRDDGTGIGYLMLVMTAVVGGVSAWFRPAGMARAMLGVATMQVLLGIAVATAPSTADIPGGATRVLLFNAFFAMLWLLSATLFRVAGREPRAGITPPVAAHTSHRRRSPDSTAPE